MADFHRYRHSDGNMAERRDRLKRMESGRAEDLIGDPISSGGFVQRQPCNILACKQSMR